MFCVFLYLDEALDSQKKSERGGRKKNETT